MAWIESHQALGHHPKTLALAAAFRCSVPTAVGYLHYLWWWALDYAPDGIVKPASQVPAARACEWHGAPDRFWSGLVDAGFLDERPSDGVLHIHDWMDYAGRLVSKRAANAERMRATRATHGTRTSGTRSANEARTSGTRAGATNQPTNRVLGAPAPVPLTDQPLNPLATTDDAAAQGAPPHAAAHAEPPPPKWEEIAPGQFKGTPNGVGEVALLKVRCPRCERSMPVDEVEGHDCELVPGTPVEVPLRRARARGGLQRLFSDAEPIPAEVQAELQRMQTERPSPEQIAAEVARLGQSPRSSA